MRKKRKIDSKEFEKEFHDQYVKGGTGLRKAQDIFYSRKVQELEYELIFSFLRPFAGKKLLFYGCGGHFSLMKAFSNMGAQVVGIDISPKTVEKLRANIYKAGINSTCEAIEMDCECLEFSPSSFDLVFGRSIIHHLDIERSLDQISMILSPEGKCAFVEPLGTNPFINIYRRMTPQDRTPTEHPLLPSDIELFQSKFNCEFHYLYAMSTLALFLRAFPGGERIYWPIFKTLNRIDGALIASVPFYRSLCWDVIILCRK